VALAQRLIGGRAFGSTEFHVLRPFGGVDSRYVLYYTMQKSLRSEARRHMTGTAGQLRVPVRFLENVEIPLAPTAEQHRIVAAIEEQFSRIDAGVEALQRARRNLQRMRAAVLQAAVTGRLVPRDPEDEPAEILLKRIIDRRRLMIVRRRSGESKASKGPQPPMAVPLPHGWAWARLEQVALTSSGGTPRRDRREYYSGTVPWVKSGELRDGLVSEVAEYLTEQGLANSSAKILPRGTLLIALYGATVGKLGILDIDHATTNQAVCAIQPILPEMHGYLWWVLRHHRTELIFQGRGGAQRNISQEILRNLVFALPPLAEQQRIVERIERYWSVLDTIETALDGAVHRGDRLRRAVLSVAFQGRLVPQDPTDAPANALLDRVRAARSPCRPATDARTGSYSR
jgi:type I restriction enzyme S subunit